MKLLSQIKKDLEFNQALFNLIEVIKEISLSQYHVLEKQKREFGDLFDCLKNIFTMISLSEIKHPLLDIQGQQAGVIAVTTDTGLVGGLNLSVINLALKEVEENKAKLIIIGEKGKFYAQDAQVSFVAFAGIKDDECLKQALELRDYIIKEELELRLGQLKIIYPYPISIVAQRVETLQLLPFVLTEFKTKEAFSYKELILESSLEDVLEYLIYLLLGNKLYEIFTLSRLAELSARFMHLEESKTKIEQLNRQLRLQYHRQRHELIDRTMRELFGARLVFG
ncbi:MAG: F0F1 ATP synthase subunit gamma [Candidatus Omnitrophica bacterium]|nr:F0F1 ATP synthase subunit gamma [Candidatus Omnitrophota bacterium]